MTATTLEPAQRAALELPAVPAALQPIAVRPGDSLYFRLRSSYMRAGSPAIVFAARNVDDVVQVVNYVRDVRESARAQGAARVPFSVRSGGHGIAGRSTNDGGIILDLAAMRTVEVVDPGAGLVRAEAGTVWAEVAAALAPFDLALTSGNFGDTGVGGLAVAAGVGYFVRSQGLTIDRIRAVEMVLADGRVVRTDAAHEPDLFWAVRGGGAMIGVVTAVEFVAEKVSDAGETTVISQQSQQVVDDLGGYVEAWGALMGAAPRAFTSFLMIHPVQGGRHIVRATNVWAGDDADAAEPSLRAFAELAPLAAHEATIAPYAHLVEGHRALHVGAQNIQLRNAFVTKVDRELGEAMARVLAADVSAVAELRSLGGAVADVAADATAFAHRDAQALVSVWMQPLGDDVQDAAWAPLQPLASGIYGAYSSDIRQERAREAWPGKTGDGLARIAQGVDPDGLFDAGLIVSR